MRVLVSAFGCGPLRLLWIGRLLPRKGLPLALEAVAVACRNVCVYLTVLGGEPQAEHVRCWIDALGSADVVEYRGQIPYHEAQAGYAGCPPGAVSSNAPRGRSCAMSPGGASRRITSPGVGARGRGSARRWPPGRTRPPG